MSTPSSQHPHLILPAGTQVVTLIEQRNSQGEGIRRSGSVGKIIKSPTDSTHAYLVHFPDGTQSSFYRHEIAIRKQVQGINFDRPDADKDDLDLYPYIIYKCTVGSRAYGLDVENSDTDRRGIYLPPADMQWSLYGLPEQIENSETQECFWELQKFLVLALKANPNILECLYTPLVEFKNHACEELLAERHRFLSKLVYQTYNGYVLSQFKKLEQDLRTTGSLKWKHVMHLVRLLSAGVTTLQEGYVPVEAVENRDKLLSIRNGEMTWEQVNDWRLALHKQFDEAHESTKLPDRPDYVWANDYLIRCRKSMVKA